MTKETLLNQLMLQTQEGSAPKMPGENKEAPQIPGDVTEASLNKISRHITFSHGTHREHHEVKTTAHHKLNILPTDYDYLLQVQNYEADLNKLQSPPIPIQRVWSHISHVIRMLNVDCTESKVQLACAKIISRLCPLMKLFSEREYVKETSTLWKTYCWPLMNVANLAPGSPRKLEKPEGDLYETVWKKRRSPFIPMKLMRNRLSHAIRILKVDCTEFKVQLACANLLSRIELLMKLFSGSENIKETPTLWKSSCCPMKNVANLATRSPRKLAKPEIASQGIPESGYGKRLFAISVSAVVTIIISVICLFETCSQRSATKDGTPQEKWTFLGRKKKGAKQYNEESSEVKDIFSWARSQMTAPSPVRKPSSKTLSAPPPVCTSVHTSVCTSIHAYVHNSLYTSPVSLSLSIHTSICTSIGISSLCSSIISTSVCTSVCTWVLICCKIVILRRYLLLQNIFLTCV
ncbi:uncharacterized protein LOC128332138 isoform X2 [Hemicordylus capensis]|nr:uncharacterized protein LOC128332138 isoform X2 [Hemicordylus capensis]